MEFQQMQDSDSEVSRHELDYFITIQIIELTWTYLHNQDDAMIAQQAAMAQAKYG